MTDRQSTTCSEWTYVPGPFFTNILTSQWELYCGDVYTEKLCLEPADNDVGEMLRDILPDIFVALKVIRQHYIVAGDSEMV